MKRKVWAVRGVSIATIQEIRVLAIRTGKKTGEVLDDIVNTYKKHLESGNVVRKTHGGIAQ